MEFHLPLYAAQRLANGQWLVRTLMGDPLWPAVDVVVVLDEQASALPQPAKGSGSPAPAMGARHNLCRNDE